jgi:hypothetical protein
VNLLQTDAQVLGQPVWNKSYTPASDNLAFGGQLDSQSLTPNGLYIRLAQPDDLGTKIFLDKTFSIHFPVAEPLLSVDASVHVVLTGDLKADAGIQVSWQNNQLTLDPGTAPGTGTFVEFVATATPTIEAKVQAQILHGWLGTFQASAFVNSTLTVTGTAQFSGPVSNPTLASTDLHASLSGSYGYSLSGTQKVTDDSIKSSDSVPFGPISLF